MQQEERLGGMGVSGRGIAAAPEDRLLPVNVLASSLDQLDGDKVALLQRFETQSTGSRLLAGTCDLLMLISIALPFIMLRAMRWILARMGIPEHRWKLAGMLHAWTHALTHAPQGRMQHPTPFAVGRA